MLEKGQRVVIRLIGTRVCTGRILYAHIGKYSKGLYEVAVDDHSLGRTTTQPESDLVAIPEHMTTDQFKALVRMVCSN